MRVRWVRDGERHGYWFGAAANVCAALGLVLAYPGVDTPLGRVLVAVLLAGTVVCAVLSLLALAVLHARRRRR